MPADDRGGLKAAFTNFSKPGGEADAELKLLGRIVGSEDARPSISATQQKEESYHVATRHVPPSGLTPKPLLQREPVRQLSLRCPVSIAAELRRKAAFNQLEQQEIIVEGIKRVLLELPDPPLGWDG